MGGDFTIHIDAARNLIEVEMRGFFSAEDVHRYHRAVVAASTTLGGPADKQVMLNDISEMQIQSQEIVREFMTVMSDPRYQGRRVGFVAASTLARKQLSRIIGSRTARIFASAREAEEWLFSPAADADAA